MRIDSKEKAVLALALIQYMKKDLTAQVEETEKAAKAFLLEELSITNKQAGWENNGELIAESLYVQPAIKVEYVVTDEGAFSDWVQQVTDRRPTWEHHLAAFEKSQSQIEGYVAKHGEIPDGVEVRERQKPAYVRTTINDKAQFERQVYGAKVIGDALRPLALEAGESNE